MPQVTVLDYGAGNIRSLVNALKLLGCSVTFVKEAGDIQRAERLIFPGVGAFGSAMALLECRGFVEPLRTYIQQDRPFLGICLGLQTLCEGSEESPGTKGLSVIPATVSHFNKTKGLAVPHMGWNGLKIHKGSTLFPTGFSSEEKVYFVHSYALHSESKELGDWVLATTDYGEAFVSMVQKGNIVATQFHPEKSGSLGIKIINNFLNNFPISAKPVTIPCELPVVSGYTQLGRRVIACLDVRNNDQGDLVVTKGEQYDVREQCIIESNQTAAKPKGAVRNLGKPVELARRYYKEGADEIVFLNITSFKNCPLNDLPMLEVLRQASENIFVPLTVGGGIRDMQVPANNGDPSKMVHLTAVEVAAEYFKSGNLYCFVVMVKLCNLRSAHRRELVPATQVPATSNRDKSHCVNRPFLLQIQGPTLVPVTSPMNSNQFEFLGQVSSCYLQFQLIANCHYFNSLTKQ